MQLRDQNLYVNSAQQGCTSAFLHVYSHDSVWVRAVCTASFKKKKKRLQGIKNKNTHRVEPLSYRLLKGQLNTHMQGCTHTMASMIFFFFLTCSYIFLATSITLHQRRTQNKFYSWWLQQYHMCRFDICTLSTAHKQWCAFCFFYANKNTNTDIHLKNDFFFNHT